MAAIKAGANVFIYPAACEDQISDARGMLKDLIDLRPVSTLDDVDRIIAKNMDSK